MSITKSKIELQVYNAGEAGLYDRKQSRAQELYGDIYTVEMLLDQAVAKGWKSKEAEYKATLIDLKAELAGVA